MKITSGGHLHIYDLAFYDTDYTEYTYFYIKLINVDLYIANIKFFYVSVKFIGIILDNCCIIYIY